MSVYDTHKPAAGDAGGLYLKINDGETVKIRIASEPVIYDSESTREGEKVISIRYAWVVFNQDRNIPQILQQSATFFNNLAGLAQDEEWGDPTQYDIKIRREGLQLETKYTITPSANREPLSDQQLTAVSSVDIIGKMQASPFAQRVMWLAEFDNQANQGLKANAPVAPTVPARNLNGQDKIIGFEDGEEINLDDIPF